MFRAAFDLKLPSPEVSNTCKVTTQQTSPGMSVLCGEGRPFLPGALPGQRMCLCPVTHEGPHRHLSASGGALSGGLKPLAAHPSTVAPPGHDASAFYAPLFRGFPLRPEGLTTLASAGQRMPFDPGMTSHPYGLLYAGLDVNGLGMRKAATRETTGPLKAWLHDHRKNPYPTKAEKIMLAIITKMTLTQVSTWFANARRRLKKESRLYTVKDGGNEEGDHTQPLKDDDDDANDTDEECGILCGDSDSDEDINVDGDVSEESDLSDREEVSPAANCPSTFSTNTSFPSSSFLASGGRPFFFYSPGISPPMGLRGPPNGVVHTNGSAHSTFSQTLPPIGTAQPTTSPGNAAGSTRSTTASSSAPVEPPSRPKIWSISEIIHSDHEGTSSSASAPTSQGDKNKDRKSERSLSPGPPVTCVTADDQKGELSLNDAPAFGSVSEGRRGSRLVSVPLRLKSRPLEWVDTPRAKKARTSPPDVKQLTDGHITPSDRPPGVGFRVYPASSSDVCPQTEALDLQTKKNSDDIRPGT